MTHLHQRVSALVDGELHGRARRRALDHLRRCDACRRELEQTAALKRRLLGLAAAEPSSDLRAALGLLRCEVGAGADGTSGRSASASGVRLAGRVLAGTGAASVALLVAAYALGGAGGRGVPAVAPPVDDLAAEFAEQAAVGPLSDPAVDVLAGGDGPQRSRPALGGAALRRTSVATTTYGAGAGDDSRAVRILQRAASAPSSVAYSAVQEVSWPERDGEAFVRLRVEHAPGQGTSYTTTDDDVASAAFVDEGRSGDAAEGAGSETVRRLIDSYDVTVGGTGVLLGRRATIVTVSSDGRLLAELWIDDSSGLLLRRSLYDRGERVRSSDLTSLRTAPRGFLEHLPPAVTGPSATRVSTQYVATLEDRGWACPRDLAETFALTRLHRLDGRRDIMHASYTDGLSTVSVFEEHGRLDRSAVAGFEERRTDGGTLWVRPGLPTVVLWEAAGTVYTVLTDAPPYTWGAVVAALPHGGAAEPSSSRLERGFQRMTDLVQLPH